MREVLDMGPVMLLQSVLDMLGGRRLGDSQLCQICLMIPILRLGLVVYDVVLARSSFSATIIAQLDEQFAVLGQSVFGLGGENLQFTYAPHQPLVAAVLVDRGIRDYPQNCVDIISGSFGIDMHPPFRR